jgi:predicted nucleic-acid-binding protein
MAENAKYTNKIKLPDYESLFKPDGKRKVRNLTMEGLENKEHVLREIQTLIDDPNKKLTKKQIQYLAQKYNATSLDDFIQSARLKPTPEQQEIINNLLQEEMRRIKTAEFTQASFTRFQKKWAMFGSPR